MAYYVAHLTNAGGSPARKVNRITKFVVHRVHVPKETIDQEFIAFERDVAKMPFGENDIGVGQSAETERTLITGLSFQEMLDIQAGTKALYVFMIVKYQDENHPLLMSKACLSYSRNIPMSCDAHNEVP